MNYFQAMIPEKELAQLQYLPTVNDLLEKMRGYGDLPAVSDLKTTYSYTELCDRVAKRRGVLLENGVKPGERVAVFDRNSIDAMEWFLAITTAGCTAIMLPAALPAPAVAGCAAKFGISLLIVRPEFAAVAEGAAVKKVDSTAIGNAAPAAENKKSTVACIFFTGGTTGAPKGVVLNHGAVMRGAYNGVFMPCDSVYNQRYIAILPLSHVFGLIRSMLSPFYTGGTVYACEDMHKIFADMPVIKPTCLVLVPGLAEMLLGAAKMKGAGLLGGELKTVISGGAPVPPRLVKDFETFGINLLPGYGLTEGANLTTGNGDIKTHPDSIGKLYDGQEAKLVNGELWLKGDNIFDGYYGDPAATAACMQDGWLKTGDLARIDKDGFVYIVGRIKNLIILKNGENVSPEEVEEAFYKLPVVKDCLVSETEQNGETVIGIEIQPQLAAFPGCTNEQIEEKVREAAREVNKTLPTYMRAAIIKVRFEDFKKTGSMKISRQQ